LYFRTKTLGTVLVAKAGARIRVIVGKEKGGFGHRLLISIPHVTVLANPCSP
jgi:hypothetical protein